jgi:tRNA pseudouridine55 synthase
MNGVLPVDKPEGPSSHDVVALARRGLGVRRIGHTGTLDPFATGLLLLCIGPATRLAEYLTGLDKGYEATALLGARTDTQDLTGRVVDTSDAWRDLPEAAIRAAFEERVGEHLQTPPAYSAKKVGGRRAYALARSGDTVRLDPVAVNILDIEVHDIDGARVRFRVRCSSGTYVRTLAADVGDRLGVGAHLTALRRTSVGSFHVDSAVPVDRLEDAAAVAAALVSPLDAVAHLPTVHLDLDGAAHIRHGRSIPALGRGDEGPVALALDGTLVAIAQASGGMILPRKVLA